MIAIGFVLMLIGFALVVPRGGGTGSVAHRNVRVGPADVTTTPGYGTDTSRRARIGIRLVGLAMLVGGLVLIVLAG
ncbi:MAG TPA: hypothetical protein VFE86_04970 [Ilumatobacteraceae bacterium]|nr:hypothetical protein [Ilumatobacteraceae bacterium]